MSYIWVSYVVNESCQSKGPEDAPSTRPPALHAAAWIVRKARARTTGPSAALFGNCIEQITPYPHTPPETSLRPMSETISVYVVRLGHVHTFQYPMFSHSVDGTFSGSVTLSDRWNEPYGSFAFLETSDAMTCTTTKAQAARVHEEVFHQARNADRTATVVMSMAIVDASRTD